MDRSPKPRVKAGVALAALVLLLLSPVLYVASAGPAAAWVVRSHAFNDDYDSFVSRCHMYERTYGPLIAAEHESERLYAASSWWRNLFLDERGEHIYDFAIFDSYR
jgi:hypothetical protein